MTQRSGQKNAFPKAKSITAHLLTKDLIEVQKYYSISYKYFSIEQQEGQHEHVAS
jgi:hypothetical protein